MTDAEKEAKRKADNKAAWEGLHQSEMMERVKQGLSGARQLAVCVASLAIDKDGGELVRELLDAHGLHVSPETAAKLQDPNGTPYLDILEYWPVAKNLIRFFADLKQAIAPVPQPTA